MTPQPPAPPDTVLIDFDRAPGHCVITLDISALADALDLASDQNRITLVATRGELRRIAAIVPVDVAEAEIAFAEDPMAGHPRRAALERAAAIGGRAGPGGGGAPGMHDAVAFATSTPGGPGGSGARHYGPAEIHAGPGSGWATRQRIPVTLHQPVIIVDSRRLVLGESPVGPGTYEWSRTVLLHAVPRVHETVTIPAAGRYGPRTSRVFMVDHPAGGSPPEVTLVPIEIRSPAGAADITGMLTAAGWTQEDT